MYYIHTKDNWVFGSASTHRQAIVERDKIKTYLTQLCNCQLRDADGRYLAKAEVPELRITDGYPERDSQPLINERFLMDVSGYKGN